jgi:tetratricopeptide (TPR) repeat protein
MKTNPIMRRLSHTLAAMGLSLVAGSASAQMFSDPALESLFADERFDELERTGLQRLAAQGDDLQALLAAALGALRHNDAGRREAVLAQAEGCLQKQTQAAICHYALGAVLGVQAASQGMLKMAASVGRVKTALTEALSLAPQWYPARGAVVEFYLLVPSLMGGSTARALETARGAARPQQVRALEARIAMQDGKHEQALAMLAELKPGNDVPLTLDVIGWQRIACFGLLNEGKAEPARVHFERLQRERSDLAFPPYGLGRIRSDAGAHEAALKLYEQSRRLKGADELPIAYREGIAQQALGLKASARASYTAFIKSGKGSKPNLDDAKQRLEQLAS